MALRALTALALAGGLCDGCAFGVEPVDVQLAVACPLALPLAIATGDGSVTLALPAGAAAELDLRGGGSVDVDVGGVVHRGDSFRGVLGAGGPLVSITSGAGRIRVREIL